MTWWVLSVAIAVEVATTLRLKAVVHQTRVRDYALVVLGYVVAFTFLAWALSLGMPIGIAYGVWAASGVALTAVLARFLLDEPLSRLSAGGIAVIAVGVTLVELGH